MGAVGYVIKVFKGFAAQVAEWSKAVRSGRILNWRGFESLLVHADLLLLSFAAQP